MTANPDDASPMTEKQYQLLRYQARIDLWKVIFGTMIVGTAVAFFPFAQKVAEVAFQERIESIKAKSAIDILERQTEFEKAKVDYQAEKEKAEALRLEEIALRDFLNALATEGRSSDIETRIRLAEYFSFVLPSTDQGSDWKGFRDYLISQRSAELERRRNALRVQLDPNASAIDKALAAADVIEIDRTLTPGISATASVDQEVSFEALGISKQNVNGTLTIPSESFLLSLFGQPATEVTTECKFPDTEPLVSQMISVDFGSTPVVLVKPAAESLQQIFTLISEEEPELAAEVQSLGGWCVRYRRGTQSSLSDHSFGLSVDVSLKGAIDVIGNNRVSPRLAKVAKYFIDSGWYWGAAFSRDDSMHFEVSRQLIEKWVSEGKLRISKPSEGAN